MTVHADWISSAAAQLLESPISHVARLTGGLVNTAYRVTSMNGRSVCVRLHASGFAAWSREQHAIARAAGAALPVPRVLHTDANDWRIGCPYTVYEWIPGMTLNECRRAYPDALTLLAAPLGRLAAAVASVSSLDEASSAGPPAEPSEIALGRRIVAAATALKQGASRLEPALAADLAGLLDHSADLFAGQEGEMGMLHGDFGGRNILVSQDSEASWRIAGLIDWEAAGRGCRLWDVGSLFRYGNRYSVDFRDRFEEGYNAMGELPCDWYRMCRLLDSLRLLDIVNGERELPDVFAECRGLIRSVIDDWS